MSHKILVFGATGKVGREVTKQLLEKGEQVKVAVRDPKKAVSIGGSDVEIAEFDYYKSDTYEGLFDNVERVFMVTPPGDTKVADCASQLIEQATQAGVKHIVLLFGGGLEAVEKSLKNSGIDYTILRSNTMMHEFTNPGMINAIKNMGGIHVPAGDGKVSYIDVRDVARVATITLTEAGHAEKAYSLMGQEALGHKEVAEHISQATGKTIPYVSISDDEARTGLKSMNIGDDMIEFISDYFRMIREGHVSSTTSDAASLLGRDLLTFKQFAQENVDCWK